MPEYQTTNQSGTPSPYNVGAATSNEGHFNQIGGTTNLQNNTPVWNEVPTYTGAGAPANSVSSGRQCYHATSSGNNISILSNQVVYNPPNYLNIPYQTNNGFSTGYTNLNPSGGINPQIANGPNLQCTENGQLIGGQAWPNQSALGRFIAQSPGWTSNKTAGVKKQKRIRTAFTTQQMMELEQEYSRTRYLDRTRRIELAEILRLNERTIKIWFQNRRMKEKKDRAESLEDSEEVSTSESSPEIGVGQMPMVINEQYPGMKNNIYNQSEAYCQGNIYVENYPATSTSIQMPMISLPPSMPATSLPPSMPAMSLPPSMPATSLPPSMPATSLPPSMPATSLQTSMPVTNLPPSMPATSVPPSIQVGSTLVPSSAPPSMPATSLPPSMPATSLQTSMPVTNLPPSMPATSVPPSIQVPVLNGDNIETNWDWNWIRASISYEE